MSSVQSATTGTVPQSLLDAMNPQTAATSTKNADGTDTVQAQTDKFMTLLVTQLQNQDPLNPMDNAQITSQLAQLSTVTGVNQLNTTLQSLMGSYQSSEALQATSMIGHGVLTAGNGVMLTSSSGTGADGSTVTSNSAIMGVDFATAADSVQLTVQDSGGTTIKTLNLGPQPAGTLPVTWDGTTDAGGNAAPGKYTFTVNAVRGTTPLTDATALTFGTVASVSTNATDGVKLNIPALGANSFVKLADVKQIL